MLVCFGASWPFSLHKTWSTKSGEGKSFVFMGLVIIGYIAGVLHKVFYHYDMVVWLYLLNAVLVSIDLTLSCYYLNRRRKTRPPAE
jgi:hypothetical protein